MADDSARQRTADAKTRRAAARARLKRIIASAPVEINDEPAERARIQRQIRAAMRGSRKRRTR